MLERFFTYPQVLMRMRRGPLTKEIDALAERLLQTGYTRLTAIRYLSLAASFSRFAEQVGCTQPEAIDEALVDRFLSEAVASVSARTIARTALNHVPRIAILDSQSMVEATSAVDPDSRLLGAFETHLRSVRGLQPRSCQGVVLVARRILASYRHRRPGRPLSALRGKDVLTFVGEITAVPSADSTRSAALSHLRALLRYLRWIGVLREDLARFVPRTACWRLAHIPRHLSWAEVESAIGAIDTSEALGKRDRALLLVLATTGLRSQEVRCLELRDVQWLTGELHVRRTKSRRQRMIPLVAEAGRALADYVLNGRPRSDEKAVFLCHRPPTRAIPHSSTVAAIVRRRLARVGIKPPRVGAHLLRHSLATRMVQHERPIKAIADLLGHQNIDTTAIYVKVALPQLADVALPYRGGVA